MKKLFLPIALLAAMLGCNKVSAQDQQQRIYIMEEDVLSKPTKSWPHAPVHQTVWMLSNGVTIHPGTRIYLGKGSLPNGDYNYIATPSNTMEAKLKGTTHVKSLLIKEIKKRGNEKYGVKYIIVCEGNYIIQLEDGVLAGEVIAPTVSAPDILTTDK